MRKRPSLTTQPKSIIKQKYVSLIARKTASRYSYENKKSSHPPGLLLR